MAAFGYAPDDMRQWDRTGIDPHAVPVAREVQLPDYPVTHTVYAFERRGANSGRKGGVSRGALTLAIAVYHRPGLPPGRVTDLVTMMRLADMLSDRHALPVNPERRYGPRGRRCPVGRERVERSGAPIGHAATEANAASGQ